MKPARLASPLLLLLILLLAAGLRFYGLGGQSLWNDEGTSVALAQRPLAAIARDASHDIHPPLYYWLLSGWVRLLGTSEAAVRSLSALLGVTLVALTYALGEMLAGRRTALAAAGLAAINPFQVYYSQEARMYMLLAVVSAGAVLALLCYVRRGSWLPLVALALLEAAGLYTHYSFLFVILILNLAFLLSLRRKAVRRLLPWLASQVAVLLLYLPWLPIAAQQLLSWPGPARATPFLAALSDAWRWLVFGPTIETGQVVLPLVVAAVVGIAGAILLSTRHTAGIHPTGWAGILLSLWLGLPVVLMFALGLYREAYLKFLLVTEPALCLLMAGGLTGMTRTLQNTDRKANRASRTARYAVRSVQLLATLVMLTATSFSLHNYYTDPAFARDDYRGIAAYVSAVGRPGDAILLDAPGQQEAFRYYYHGNLPVHPLPAGRPLDPAETEEALARLAQPGARVFAVLWATDESDPNRFIESWLDEHAYRAVDSWYGNVRLVVYAVPEELPSSADHTLNSTLTDTDTGDAVTLLGYSLATDHLEAGDIAPISLFWQTAQTLSRRYKVFLHVLDGSDRIVGQRDAEPGGGARLTTLWAPGDIIADHYGVPIHPATPPGTYRIEAGMYDAETGRRLVAPDGATQVWLRPVTIERPAAPPPVAALAMEFPHGADFGEFSLLGYDAHRLGFAGQPDVALRPGDILHVNLYWRAAEQPTGDWQVALQMVGPDGQPFGGIAAEPVSGYPTSRWQAGDVWRGQFDIPIPSDVPAGRYRLNVQPISPDGARQEPFVSEPLRIGS